MLLQFAIGKLLQEAITAITFYDSYYRVLLPSVLKEKGSGSNAVVTSLRNDNLAAKHFSPEASYKSRTMQTLTAIRI